MRERMNRLKARQWYRPVAPMIAEDSQGHGEGLYSASRQPPALECLAPEFPQAIHVLCWAFVGLMLGVCRAYVGPMLGHLGPMLCHIGPVLCQYWSLC